MYKLGIEKAKEPEIKLTTFIGSWRKQESFRKTSISASLSMPKPLTVWVTTNYGKFLKGWKYQITLPVSWKTCTLVNKQKLEPYMEQLGGSKLGKKHDKAVYRHPAYLIYMQSTSRKMLDWMNHKLEIRLLGEISTISDMQMTLL